VPLVEEKQFLRTANPLRKGAFFEKRIALIAHFRKTGDDE
jgi:hypothetical protein